MIFHDLPKTIHATVSGSGGGMFGSKTLQAGSMNTVISGAVRKVDARMRARGADIGASGLSRSVGEAGPVS
jgi:hypothetical protein